MVMCYTIAEHHRCGPGCYWSKTMKCLIAEDDLVARKLLETILSEVSECHTSVNGKKAVAAFKMALDEGEPYDLLCLDIMMPEMDGHQALQAIRELEEAACIEEMACARVIMITSAREPSHVLGAFRRGCEAYIVKPVNRVKLFEEMEKLALPTKTA
jgi:two-component system chemotaxis response regulator CheY